MSLKIIHTADWHLGQTFFGYDREEEHDAFLSWLVEALKEHEVDVLLISGDVFDVANPSASAQRRFFSFLREANLCNPHLQIVVTAGNHDSAARLESPLPLLEELSTSIVGVVRRTAEGTIDFDAMTIPLYNREGRREAWCLAVPYLRQGDYPASEEAQSTYAAGIRRMYRQFYDYVDARRESGEAIVAMGHLHATGAELTDDDPGERVIKGGLESVPSDAFNPGLAYTALGHIHKAQHIGERSDVCYSGSPLPMSFSEKNYRHRVMLVTIEDGHLAAIEPLEIPLLVPLMRVPERPLPPAEVIERLNELPSVEEKKEEPQSLWPYVEVRVLLTEPDPGFRQRVEEALTGKAVRLTAILTSYPSHESGRGDGEESPYGDLRQIDPLQILKDAFRSKYGRDLPEEIESLFKEVIRDTAI